MKPGDSLLLWSPASDGYWEPVTADGWNPARAAFAAVCKSQAPLRQRGRLLAFNPPQTVGGAKRRRRERHTLTVKSRQRGDSSTRSPPACHSFNISISPRLLSPHHHAPSFIIFPLFSLFPNFSTKHRNHQVCKWISLQTKPLKHRLEGGNCVYTHFGVCVCVFTDGSSLGSEAGLSGRGGHDDSLWS